MNILAGKFNFFGELKDPKEEEKFLQENWGKSKWYFIISYNLCCILLLFAGIFRDYQRHYFWGSADILTVLRSFHVFFGLLLIPLYARKKEYQPSSEWYGFFLMAFGTFIVIIMGLMIHGASATYMAGILILTVSFYVVVPSKFIFAFLPSMALFLTYCGLYFFHRQDLKAHIYMCFMLFSINTVLCLFKITYNKHNRMNYLVKEFHKEMNETKNNIIKIIGHDLRNPMTIINLQSSVMQSSLNAGKYDKLQKQITSVKESSKRVNDLLKSLLDWALKDIVDKPIVKEEVNIKDICLKAIKLCENQAMSKMLNIKIDVEDNKLSLDKNMIETVIRNLVTNAIKFSNKGEEILVKGGIIDTYYMLSVIDYGVGIPSETLQTLQNGLGIHSSEGTSGEAGTGFGLKLVHGFIKGHNADLRIESTEGQGSTFSIQFPIS